jgi:hypothetical protein
MSYDLQVYAPRGLANDAVPTLVNQIAGLTVDAIEDRWLTVSRGAHRRYSFTVDGPDRLEPEDVPPEVTSCVLDARCLYSVTVEGGCESEIPYAVRFAKLFAKTLDGAVVDQQTGEIWSRSQSRTIQRPSRQERVAAVDLTWFSLRKHLPVEASSLMVSAAERYLPEALPRRFGQYEPLQGKYVDVGEEGFKRAWRAATSSLFFSGSLPCIGGNLNAGPNERFLDNYWSMSMTFLAEALKEHGWRDAVRRLFTTLADELHAFYSSAQVSRNNIWSGRSLWMDGETELPIRTLRFRQGWLGLPPTPTWWSWFGAPYSFVVSLLPRDGLTATTVGTLFETATEPGPPDSMPPLGRWLPANLFASIGPNPHRQQPVPLIRASEIPHELVAAAAAP